jgi:hypothetical protein
MHGRVHPIIRRRRTNGFGYCRRPPAGVLLLGSFRMTNKRPERAGTALSRNTIDWLRAGRTAERYSLVDPLVFACQVRPAPTRCLSVAAREIRLAPTPEKLLGSQRPPYLSPSLNSELLKDPVNVVLDRRDRNAQYRRDFTIREPLRNEKRDLTFPLAEFEGAGRWARTLVGHRRDDGCKQLSPTT